MSNSTNDREIREGMADMARQMEALAAEPRCTVQSSKTLADAAEKLRRDIDGISQA
jgi:hypothetical protein